MDTAMKNSLSALATMEAASVEISGMDGLDKDDGGGREADLYT
jgi:hypothetical protein